MNLVDKNKLLIINDYNLNYENLSLEKLSLKMNLGIIISNDIYDLKDKLYLFKYIFAYKGYYIYENNNIIVKDKITNYFEYSHIQDLILYISNKISKSELKINFQVNIFIDYVNIFFSINDNSFFKNIMYYINVKYPSLIVKINKNNLNIHVNNNLLIPFFKHKNNYNEILIYTNKTSNFNNYFNELSNACIIDTLDILNTKIDKEEILKKINISIIHFDNILDTSFNHLFINKKHIEYNNYNIRDVYDEKKNKWNDKVINNEILIFNYSYSILDLPNDYIINLINNLDYSIFSNYIFFHNLIIPKKVTDYANINYIINNTNNNLILFSSKLYIGYKEETIKDIFYNSIFIDKKYNEYLFFCENSDLEKSYIKQKLLLIKYLQINKEIETEIDIFLNMNTFNLNELNLDFEYLNNLKIKFIL